MAADVVLTLQNKVLRTITHQFWLGTGCLCGRAKRKYQHGMWPSGSEGPAMASGNDNGMTSVSSGTLGAMARLRMVRLVRL